MIIKLLGKGNCRVIFDDNSKKLTTSMSKEFGGTGDSFSSTDLISAALATCIGSSIDMILQREGIPLKKVSIEVKKKLNKERRVIHSLSVTIDINHIIKSKLKIILYNAAKTCAVKKSLNPDIDIPIVVKTSLE